MNVYLPGTEEKEITFSGVLFAKEGKQEWEKWVEVKDLQDGDKNNPYFLFIDEGMLHMTVVDQRGGGSGEGTMHLLALESKDNWSLKGCYYFGHNYGDPLVDGDYYAHSILLDQQLVEPMSTCRYLEISQG
jgi:hypothetical protein